MLALDFINVGNGDSILIRELDAGRQTFAMLVDCGHDNLVRDDHPPLEDDRSRRIYAGDFLRKNGVTRLDLLLVTHFHRDHIGGLGRVLDAVEVDELVCTYLPPLDAPPLEPDRDMTMPRAARNLMRCVEIYASALRTHPGRIKRVTVLPGDRTERRQLTEALSMDILCGEPALYPRQKVVYDAAFQRRENAYDLIHWGKSMKLHPLRHPEGPPPRLAVLHHPEAAAYAAAPDGGGLRGRRPPRRAAPPLHRLPAERRGSGGVLHRRRGHPRPGGARLPRVRPSGSRVNLIRPPRRAAFFQN